MLNKIITTPSVRAVNFRDFLALTLVAACLFLNTSCAIDDGDTYLYDKTGFDVGASPQIRDPQATTTRVAPDYYYRQPTYAAPSPYIQPQAPQAYQPQAFPPAAIVPQPTYSTAPQQTYVAQPYPQPPAPVGVPVYYPPQQAAPVDVGGSRYYTNPYAIPPSTQAPRYDGDQFYVPPTYRNNIEPQVPQGRSVSY